MQGVRKSGRQFGILCARIANIVGIVQDIRMIALDPKDLQLLALLQKDGQRSMLDLSHDLGMSASQIGRRRLRLEQAGVIVGTPARLDAGALGLRVQAFIQVQTNAQTGETHQSIQRLIGREPQITAAWTLTGDADYLFRVYCRDLAALNALVQDVLLPHEFIGRVQSQIVMEQMKDDTALPL